MGTGRTNSARASRRPVKFATPNSRAKKVGTGAVTLTRRTLSFTGSCAAVTTTPPTPSWNPFLLASFFAAVTAPLTFDGRKTTPASAPASAARCTRIMFTSNHDASATSPVKPRSSVSISANTTRVCPRSSSSLARDIERHHGVVGDPDRVEVRHEEAEWRLRAIRVHDGHADGVDRRAAEPRALARRGSHGHVVAQERAELDEPEDEEDHHRRQDERELDQALAVVAPDEAPHSCGSPRAIDVSVKTTPPPAMRAKLVIQVWRYVTRTPIVSTLVCDPPHPASTSHRVPSG